MTGSLEGDKKRFTNTIWLDQYNIAELRRFLNFDDKDSQVFFTEENFVMLLYFACVSMSIEDQPFNELPAIPSARVRRFFMKQILYEMGVPVGDYMYVVENLAYAMEEIKVDAAQQRYAYNPSRSSSSRILFGSDSEDGGELPTERTFRSPNSKRSCADDDGGIENSKRIKQ